MGPIGLIDPFEQITAQAVRDLAACGAAPKIGFAEKLRAFFGRKTAPFDPLNWPAGMLLLGLWEAGEEEAVKHYFDCWLEGDGAVLRVDDALAGAVLAELFRAGADARYGEAVKKVYDFLQAAPKNEEGCLYYRPGDGREAVFADGAGMAALFYVRYAMAFSDEAALRAARNELAGFFRHGTDAETGLPWHAYTLREDKKLGILGWGRAAGWLLLGLSAYEQATEAVGDEEMRDWYRDLCRAAAKRQAPEGLFPWQLAEGVAQTDTSASGMIAYAMMTGNYLQMEETGEETDAVTRCVSALWDAAQDGTVGGALAECRDLGDHPQTYGHYPWGQGAALLALSLSRRLQTR